MKKFDEIYVKESTALQICIRNKSEKLRLEDFEDACQNSKNWYKRNYYKRKGNIKMLPSSFSYISDLIDVLKQSDETGEYIKNKIKMVELMEKEEGNKNNSSAFKTERKQEKT